MNHPAHPDLPASERITIVDSGTFNGIRWWVTSIDRSEDNIFGARYQYNGYAELPEDHPVLMEKVYDSAYIHPHGGVTYEKGRIVGFDTNHLMDLENPWSMEQVRAETMAMANEIAETNTEANRERERLRIETIDQIRDIITAAEKRGITIDPYTDL